MAKKPIIIIGAGIAGLCTGCYTQMNGYQTRIYEMHDKPGGLCTSWQRKGYTIDGCLHWLVGSGPGTDFYRLWKEVGALQNRQIVNMDQFMRFEDSTGKALTVYTDINQLEQHMKEVSPEDSKLIEEFAEGVRTFTTFEMPLDRAPELYNPLDTLKQMVTMFPQWRHLAKWTKISIQDFFTSFQSTLLRESFLATWPTQ